MTAKRVKRARNLAKRETFLAEVRERGLLALKADQLRRKSKKDAETQEIEKSIDEVLSLRNQFHEGENTSETRELRHIAKKELYKREAALAHELKERGYSTADIARKMKRSENTVRLYLKKGV